MEEHPVQRQQQQQEEQQHLEEISSEPILIEENSVVVNGGHWKEDKTIRMLKFICLRISRMVIIKIVAVCVQRRELRILL